VSDGSLKTLSPGLTVQVGTLPTVTITSPADGSTFMATETIDFKCQGNDGGNGQALPSSAHVWSMVRRGGLCLV
jgi:hypothetical protein